MESSVQPIRYDEAFAFLQFASKPLAAALSDYSYPNNHLFHTLLVHMVWLLQELGYPALKKSEAMIPRRLISLIE